MLVRGTSPAGAHRMDWDGRATGGRSLGAGLYFARLRLDGQEWTKAVVKLD